MISQHKSEIPPPIAPSTVWMRQPGGGRYGHFPSSAHRIHVPWASAEEIARFLRCSVSAVNRELNRQQERGLIVHVRAGRKKRPARRWILSSLGVAEAFPFPGDVPWWVTEQGVKTLFQRLEQLEHYYSLAPSIFSLEPEWWAGPGAPALLNWGFFQRGQVIEAWGRYEEDLLIFFCWGGPRAEGEHPEIQVGKALLPSRDPCAVS